MRAWILFAILGMIGGCGMPAQPPLPPAPPPAHNYAVDRAETEFFLAERIWPSAERALFTGQTITVTLRVTAKVKLEYLLWREVIGGYAVQDDLSSTSDLEFLVLQLPAGATQEWHYGLTGTRSGEDVLDGIIKAVSGPFSSEARVRVSVSVK